MTNEVIKSESKLTLIDFIENNPKFKIQLQKALPKYMNPERFGRILLTVIRNNPELLECTQASILGACIQAAQLGLEPGDGRNLIHFIPYNDRKNNKKVCQVQIGYKGMSELATRSGKVISIIPGVIHEKDFFAEQKGYSLGNEIEGQYLKHRTYLGKEGRGEIVGFYAKAVLKDGTCEHWVMSKAEVDEIKNTSQAARSSFSPWNNTVFYPAMGMKTVLKKVCKYLPESGEDLGMAMDLDDKGEMGKQDLEGRYEIITGELEHQKQEIENKKPKKQTDKIKQDLKDTFELAPEGDPFSDQYKGDKQ
jgi:recombination protein RecT